MGLLDDAIREHLDLMRRHGANEAEVARQEAEALGPVLREEGEAHESGSAPPAGAEAGSSLPYDRAAEAGLTGEPDLPSFEWHGSSTAEPDVPSFVSPEPPLERTEPESDGVESRADAEGAPGATEAFDVVEDGPAVEEPEMSIEPDVPEAEGTLDEERSEELDPSPEPAVVPEPSTTAAAPEPEGSFDPAVGEPGVSLEPPQEPAFPEAPPLEAEPPPPHEHAPPFEDEPPLTADTPLEDETAFWPAPTEDDLAASSEPDPFESAPGLAAEASEEPAVPPRDHELPEDEATAFHPAVGAPEPAPADVDDLPREPGPLPPEGVPLTLDAEDLPPEQEPPPPTAGVGEPPVDLDPGEPPVEESLEPPVEESLEPPVEEPFVAGEEEAWRETGEAPGDISDSLPEPPLAGASSFEDLDPHPARPVEVDALFEPADELPLDERPLRGPAPDAELPTPEPLDASAGDPLDTPAEPPQPLPADPEAPRGFFDETAEYERPSREERSRTVDPDFED